MGVCIEVVCGSLLTVDFESYKPSSGLSKLSMHKTRPDHSLITIDNVCYYYYLADDSISRDNYMLESSQMMYPFKKRKFFNQTSSSTSDRGSHCHGTYDSSDTRVDNLNFGSGSTINNCLLLFLFILSICWH